jgi:hypothetical protein
VHHTNDWADSGREKQDRNNQPCNLLQLRRQPDHEHHELKLCELRIDGQFMTRIFDPRFRHN